jgi:hypothetical protein
VQISSQARPRKRAIKCKLNSPGWNERTRAWLEKLIQKGAGKNLPVVFDFDNTIICGDVSEATLAVLVNSGKLQPARFPATLSPAFRLRDRSRLTLDSSVDLTAYYEAFLAPTAHGSDDPTPASNGYVWAVEVMEGLTPQDVVDATRTAFELSQPGRHTLIQVTPGKTAFPIPFFHPEMVELIAELLRHRFDVWIVSAGNVWSIRWMILKVLNPLLQKLGLEEGLRADHIIGVTTLLSDRNDFLYKDTILVRQEIGYACLLEKSLKAYRLTSRLQFPVPVYSGKVACLLDALPRAPYLCLGDAPGDHRMLAFSENRLVIARMEKPEFLSAALALMGNTGSKGWMVQPTLTSEVPGFFTDPGNMPLADEKISGRILESISLVARFQRILDKTSAT